MMADHLLTHLQLVTRLSLGLILLGSAVAKLRDPAAFVRGVLEYRVLPQSVARLYGWVLPFVELGTALLLLSGLVPLFAASLTILLLVSFAIALTINAARGRAIPCHCFGAGITSRIGWHSLARDVVLLPPGFWLLWAALDAPARSSPPAMAALVAAVCTAAVATLAYALLAEGLDLFASAPR